MSNRDDLPREPMDHVMDELSIDDALMLAQVRTALSPMPPVDRRAIASILTAVAERRPSTIGRLRAQLEFAVDRFLYITSPTLRLAAVATACLAVGFVARGLMTRDASMANAPSATVASSQGPDAPSTGQPGTVPSAALTVQTVNDTVDPASALVPVQFVLDARAAGNATTVSVVGDFNEWNASATPMALDRGAWSVSVPTTQGRHVYAFVINGERWIADPRAPRAADSDFGRPGSVIIVQVP